MEPRNESTDKSCAEASGEISGRMLIELELEIRKVNRAREIDQLLDVSYESGIRMALSHERRHDVVGSLPPRRLATWAGWISVPTSISSPAVAAGAATVSRRCAAVA